MSEQDQQIDCYSLLATHKEESKSEALYAAGCNRLARRQVLNTVEAVRDVEKGVEIKS